MNIITQCGGNCKPSHSLTEHEKAQRGDRLAAFAFQGVAGKNDSRSASGSGNAWPAAANVPGVDGQRMDPDDISTEI